MELFNELTKKGTYATRARAVKKITDKMAEWDIDFRWLIGVTEEGRFYPVVILNRDQQHLMLGLATCGICTAF